MDICCGQVAAPSCYLSSLSQAECLSPSHQEPVWLKGVLQGRKREGERLEGCAFARHLWLEPLRSRFGVCSLTLRELIVHQSSLLAFLVVHSVFNGETGREMPNVQMVAPPGVHERASEGKPTSIVSYLSRVTRECPSSAVHFSADEEEATSWELELPKRYSSIRRIE